MMKRARDTSNVDVREEVLHKIKTESPERKEHDNAKPSSPLKQIAHLELSKSKIETSSTESESVPSPSRGMEQLESARAEMGEVKEENKRLKTYLERVTREYKTLQMQFLDIVKQDQDREQQPKDNPSYAGTKELEESDFVSLSLGRVSGLTSSGKDEKSKNKDHKINEEDIQEGLTLSLDCKFEATKSATSESLPNNTSRENSSEVRKEEAGEIWPPSKVLKTMRSGDDEVSQQNPTKKARVCVRARCDTPTMNDGCQWRKYGQKIAKGNPCPRAYYRCTVAPSCPVRKQVQRCADDMSILITTYEGTHSHPLPVSATAMASTTSAAASMLMSGSTTSGSGQGVLPTVATTDLHGLNYYLSDPSRQKQFYLPNSSPLTPSPAHPTITLDLTAPSSMSSSAPSYLNQFSSATNYCSSMPRYSNSSTSLNFGSPEPMSSRPVSWGSRLYNYGTADHQLFNKSNPQESFAHLLPYHQKTNNNPQDSIAAATKAITTDPNFQSALAAALKSIIGGSSSAGNRTTPSLANFQSGAAGGDVFSQKSRWNESLTSTSGAPVFGPTAVPQMNACGSSYLNKSSAPTNSHHQSPSLMFLQSNPISLPLSSSKQNAAATSPGDSRDRNSL